MGKDLRTTKNHRGLYQAVAAQTVGFKHYSVVYYVISEPQYPHL